MTFSEAHARIAQLLAESPWHNRGWTFSVNSHNGDLCGGARHSVEYRLSIDEYPFSTKWHPTPDAVVEQLESAITGRTKPIDLSAVDVDRVQPAETAP